MDTSMEMLALKETILLKKIQLLQDELHITKAEMEYVRMFHHPEPQKVISEPSPAKDKSETIPEQTAPGKEITNPLLVVDLPKIQSVRKNSLPEQQKVISEPSSAMSKSEASPEQTATGKGISTPLIPVVLGKNQTEVQTSTTLIRPSDLNLRPNGGIQIPIKTEGQSSANPQGYSGVKAYYVVFNGPNPGIYTSWTVAEQAVKGISGIKHKKYKAFEEAKAAANVFTNAQFKPPLELICSAEALRPSYSKVLTKEASSKIKLGTIIRRESPLTESTEEYMDTYYTHFNYLYRIGRSATEKEFSEEHFFTSDKKNLSYFNFYEGSHPEMVLEAYQYGLLSTIYPSNNLLEISKMPEEIRKAVKNYRLKCLKNSDKKIFIKTSSTVIFWDQGDEPVHPYHYMQIGVIKEKVYSPSQACEATTEKEDLQELAEQKLLILINKMFSIEKTDKLKVNLASHNCLVTSYSHKELSDEEFTKIQAFRQQLVHPRVFGYHYPSLCTKVKKEMKKKSIIITCDSDKCLPTNSVEKPTTKEEEDKLSKAAGKAAVEE